MEEFVFPPSPSWFLPNITNTREDGSICYGSKNNVVILKTQKKTLKILLIQGAHGSRVTAVAFAPAHCSESLQNTVVSSSEDGVIKLWCIDTLTTIMSHKHHSDETDLGRVVSLDWSTANPRFIVSVADNNSLVLWDVLCNTTVKFIFQKLGATIVSCCPYNDKVVAIGGKSGEIYVITLIDHGNIIYKLRGHDNKIQSLSWCPIPYNIFKKDEIVEEFLLASGCQSKEIFIWRVGSDGKCEDKFLVPTVPLSSKDMQHYAKIKNTFSYLTLSWLEPYRLYTSSSFGELIYFDFKTLLLNKSLPEANVKGKSNKRLLGLVKLAHNFHSKGLYAISGLPVKAQVRLYKTMSIESELQFPIINNNTEFIKGSENEDSDCSWDVVVPDSSTLVWTSGQDRKLIACEISSSEVNRVFNCHTLNGSVYCAVVCPQDPNKIAVGVGDGMIRLLNLTEPLGDIQIFWQKIKDRVMSLDWHPKKDGLLAYGTSEGRVGLLDTTSNKLPSVFKPNHPQAIYNLSWGPEFSTNGNSDPKSEFDLYAVGNNILSVYNCSKLNEEPLNLSKLIPFPCKKQTDVRWKPDYSVMAVGNEDGSICLIEPVEFNIVYTLLAYKKLIQSISWHPMSTATDTGLSSLNGYFTSGSTDNEYVVKVFQYRNEGGKTEVDVVARLKGHFGHIQSVSWNPHIKGQLISNSVDGSVQIWDVISETPLVNFIPIGLPVFSIWSPIDPDFVLTGCKNNIMCFWEINRQTEVNPSSDKIKKHKKDKETSRSKTQLDAGGEVKENIKACSCKTLAKWEANVLPKASKESKMFSKIWKSEDFKNCYCLLKNNTENKNFSLPFLCDEEYFKEAIKAEEEIHKKANNWNEFVELSLWRGNIKEVLEEKIVSGQLNDFLVSLAPLISPRHWQEACLSYSKTLAERKLYRKAASYLIVCHKIYEAVQLLSDANLHLEAICIAKSRLPKSDPILEKIIRKYAEWLFKNGSYLKACECYIFLGDYLEVANICRKKNQAEYLSLAALAAQKQQYVELEAVEAANAIFKCLETENYDLAQEICDNHCDFKYLRVIVFTHQSLNELFRGELDIEKDILSYIRESCEVEDVTFPETIPKLFHNYTFYRQKEQVLLIVSLELSFAACKTDPEEIATHIVRTLSISNRYIPAEGGEIHFLYKLCHWISPEGFSSPNSFFSIESRMCSSDKLKSLRAFLGTSIIRYLSYNHKSENDLKLFDLLVSLKDNLLDEDCYKYYQNLIEIELLERRLLRNRLELAKSSSKVTKQPKPITEKNENSESSDSFNSDDTSELKNLKGDTESLNSELKEDPNVSIKTLYVRSKPAVKKLWEEEKSGITKPKPGKLESSEFENGSSLEEKVMSDLNFLEKIKTEVAQFERRRVSSPNPVPIYFMLRKICEAVPENSSANLLLNYLQNKWATLNS